MEELEDYQLWYKYPQHRLWFNKLYVADCLGYYCGPCGTAPTQSGKYIIRPCYNLAGMGLGAQVLHIEAGDRSATPPGYFWSAYFSGQHYSASYSWVNNSWQPLHCWAGYNSEDNLIKFTRWIRTAHCPVVPYSFNVLRDVGGINIEFKGSKVIEVHLRSSGNPDGSTHSSYNEYIPVWRSDSCSLVSEYTSAGYSFIDDSCDMSDVTLYTTEHRIGFLVR